MPVEIVPQLQLHAVALRAASAADASELMEGCAPAVLGSSHHEELRVVGDTLFHCDLSQEIVLARYTVQEGTTVGPGGTAVFANFSIGGVVTRGLCVVRDNGRRLSVYLPSSGECHEMPLPFQGPRAQAVAPTLWPLDFGIALAYDPPPTPSSAPTAAGPPHRMELNPPPPGASFAIDDDEGGDGGMTGSGQGFSGCRGPTGPKPAWASASSATHPAAESSALLLPLSPLALLYTLTHPLDEPRPVHMPRGSLPSGARLGCGGASEGVPEQVLWVHRHPGWPLAVAVTRTVMADDEIPSNKSSSGGGGGGRPPKATSPQRRRLGRRAVWALRQCGAEGFEGDRYDPNSPAHRSRRGCAAAAAAAESSKHGGGPGSTSGSSLRRTATTMHDQTGGGGGRGGCGLRGSMPLTPVRGDFNSTSRRGFGSGGATVSRVDMQGENDPVIGLVTDSIAMELQHESLLSSLRHRTDSGSLSSAALSASIASGGCGLGFGSTRLGDPTSFSSTNSSSGGCGHRWGSTLRSSGALGSTQHDDSNVTTNTSFGGHDLSTHSATTSPFGMARHRAPPSQTPSALSSRRVRFPPSPSNPADAPSNNNADARRRSSSSNNDSSSMSVGGETPLAARHRKGTFDGDSVDDEDMMLVCPASERPPPPRFGLTFDDDDDDGMSENLGRKLVNGAGEKSLMRDDAVDDLLGSGGGGFDNSIDDSLLGKHRRAFNASASDSRNNEDSGDEGMPRLNVAASPTRHNQRGLRPSTEHGDDDESDDDDDDDLLYQLPMPQFRMECVWREKGDESDDDGEMDCEFNADEMDCDGKKAKDRVAAGVAVGERVLVIDTPLELSTEHTPCHSPAGHSPTASPPFSPFALRSAEKKKQKRSGSGQQTLCFVDGESGRISAFSLEFYRRRGRRCNSNGGGGSSTGNGNSALGQSSVKWAVRVGSSYDLSEKLLPSAPAAQRSALAAVSFAFAPVPPSAAAAAAAAASSSSSSSSCSQLSSASVVDVPLPHSGLHAAPTRQALAAHALALAAEQEAADAVHAATSQTETTAAPAIITGSRGALPRSKRLLVLLQAAGGGEDGGGVVLSDGSDFACAACVVTSAGALAAACAQAKAVHKDKKKAARSSSGGGGGGSCGFVASTVLGAAMRDAAGAGGAGGDSGGAPLVKLRALALLGSAGDFVDVLCESLARGASDTGGEASGACRGKGRSSLLGPLLVARVQVNVLSPSGCSLTMDALAVADSVFACAHGSSESLSLRADVALRVQENRRAACSLDSSFGSKGFAGLARRATASSKGAEWLALLEVLLGRFSSSPAEPSSPAAQEGGCGVQTSNEEVGEEDGAWALLLGSEFHATFEQQQGGVLGGVFGSASSFGVRGLSDGSKQDAQAVKNKNNKKKKAAAASLMPSTSSSSVPAKEGAGAEAAGPSAATTRGLAPLWGRAEALRLLWGLHLLYEDKKLCPQEAMDFKALGQVLEALARAVGLREYEEHYRRDRGASSVLQRMAASGDEDEDDDDDEEGDEERERGRGQACSSNEDEGAWGGGGRQPVPAAVEKLSLLRHLREATAEEEAATTMENGSREDEEEGGVPRLPTQPPCLRTHLLTLLQLAFNPTPPFSSPHTAPSPQFPCLKDGRYALSRTGQVCSVYSAMACANRNNALTLGHFRLVSVAVKGVEAMVACGLSTHDLSSSLPVGIALPLQHCLRVCRLHPPPVWCPACFALCGRTDLALLLPKKGGASVERGARASGGGSGNKGGATDAADMQDDDDDDNDDVHNSPSSSTAHSCPTHASSSGGGEWCSSGSTVGTGVLEDAMATFPSTAELQGTDEAGDGSGGAGGQQPQSAWVSELDGQVRRADKDGLVALEASTEVRFSSDLRVREVCRLLSSAKLHCLVVPRPPEASDAEFIHLQHAKLLLLATRALAATVGRGALTLGTLKPRAALAEPLAVPSLCLNGRTPPRNTVTRLDLASASAQGGAAGQAAAGGLPAALTEQSLLVWPAFHNGVASGLRLAPAPPPLQRGATQKQGGGGGLGPHHQPAPFASAHGGGGSGGEAGGGWGGAVGYGSGGNSRDDHDGGGDRVGGSSSSSSSSFLSWPVTRNWIAYNASHIGALSSGAAEGAAAAAAASGGAESGAAKAATIAAKASYGGLLLGLGMHRHLGALQKPDLYRFLKEGHEPTAVGLLLGMGCHHRGTANADANIIIRMHIPHTYDQVPGSSNGGGLGASVSTEVSAVTQASAVAALGLLYMGTNNRQISDFLLNEMGRKPSSERFDDREAYSLAAGFALGLVTLGAGNNGGTAGRDAPANQATKKKQEHGPANNGSGWSDAGDNSRESNGEAAQLRGGGNASNSSSSSRHRAASSPSPLGGNQRSLTANMLLEQRLHRFIVGGRDLGTNSFSDQSSGVGAAGCAGGCGGGGAGAGGSDLGLASAAGGVGAAAGAGGSGAGEAGAAGQPSSNRSFRVSDGEFINTNVTAPGATLALALCFLKSNDDAVAERLALPDTHPLLDYCRPDQLLLRVLARSLILWDSVEASPCWVLEQVPGMVKEAWNVLGTPEASQFGKAFVLRSSADDDETNETGEGKEKGSAGDADNAATDGGEEFGGGGGGGGEELHGELDMSGLGDLLAPVSEEDEGREEEEEEEEDEEDEDREGNRADQRDSPLNGGGGDDDDDEGISDGGANSPAVASSAAASSTAAATAGLAAGGTSSGSSASSHGASVDVPSVRQAHANCVAGAVLGLGLRFAGTADHKALETVKAFAEHFKALRDGKPNASVAIGKHGCGPEPPPPLKDGEDGGGSESGGVKVGQAFSTMFGAASAARQVASQKLSAQKPDRVTLETCLGCAALGVGCIMAGTGDLAALRLIRELRLKVDPEVTYGNHLAIHLALGLLFLGGGSLTLGRDLPQLACLAIACWPRFPSTPHDNQYHLQPLRHFYVLAAEPRSFVAIDVDTQRPVFVPVEIQVEVKGEQSQSSSLDVAPSQSPLVQGQQGRPKKASSGGGGGSGGGGARTEVLSVVAPCLMSHDLGSIVQLSVQSSCYYPLVLRPREHPEHLHALRSFKILVKRKPGHLSYASDPHGLHSVAAHDSGGDGVQEKPLHLCLASDALVTIASPLAPSSSLSSSSSSSVRSHARRGLCLAATSLGEDPALASLAHHFAGLSPSGNGEAEGGEGDTGGFGQGLLLSALGQTSTAGFQGSSQPSSASLVRSLSFSGLCGEALLSCVPAANLDALPAFLALAPWRQRLFTANARSSRAPKSAVASTNLLSAEEALAQLPAGCDLSASAAWELKLVCALSKALSAAETHQCAVESKRNGTDGNDEEESTARGGCGEVRGLKLPSEVIHALPPHCVAEAERSVVGLFAACAFTSTGTPLLDYASSSSSSSSSPATGPGKQPEPAPLTGVSPLGHYLRTGRFAFPRAQEQCFQNEIQEEQGRRWHAKMATAFNAFLIFNGFPSPTRLRSLRVRDNGDGQPRMSAGLSVIRLAREMPGCTPVASLLAIRKELQ